MATLIDYVLILLDLKEGIMSSFNARACIQLFSDPGVSKCNQARWPSNCTGLRSHDVMGKAAIRGREFFVRCRCREGELTCIQ